VSSEASRAGRAPVRLAPTFVPRIWGARNLAPLFPERGAEPEPIGEAWLSGDECLFATGPFRGQSLGKVWPSLSPEFTGTRLTGLPRIPILVKFIFPEEKLSVQVHPNDAYAREKEAAAGGAGKTEMWYVIEARKDAALRVGLRAEVTRESFERAIEAGTAEECLASVPVRAGEAVYVPAGTAHTICPGVTLCEIQQQSDITYRVFDYNRVGKDGKPRELHIRQALEVMKFGKQLGGLCHPVRLEQSGGTETLYAACPYFATERWEFGNRLKISTSPERFELLIFLGGRGRMEFAGGAEAFSPAEVWLVPAGLGDYNLVAENHSTLLRTYVPDLIRLSEQLRKERVEESALAQVVHA
jgi:mannose-6-phosphate isomerase